MSASNPSSDLGDIPSLGLHERSKGQTGNPGARTGSTPATVECDCAHLAPTMPTFRDEHFPTCPVAVYGAVAWVQAQRRA
jgi:hypothetical protein